MANNNIDKSVLEVFGEKSKDGDNLQSLIDMFSTTYDMGQSEYGSPEEIYTSPGGREQQQKLLLESLRDQGYGKWKAEQIGGDYARNRLRNDITEASNMLTHRPHTYGEFEGKEGLQVLADLISNIVKSQKGYK